MVNSASSENSDNKVGLELPEFMDGPSIYQYAKSAPALNIDLTGLAAGDNTAVTVSNGYR